MKLVILAVGRGRNSIEHDLATKYIKRLPDGGEIREIESKFPAGPKRQQDEAKLLLRLVPDNGILVCLDPRGRDISSEILASKIAEWRNQGEQSIYFVIGGAEGLPGSSPQHLQNKQKDRPGWSTPTEEGEGYDPH